MSVQSRFSQQSYRHSISASCCTWLSLLILVVAGLPLSAQETPKVSVEEIEEHTSVLPSRFFHRFAETSLSPEFFSSTPEENVAPSSGGLSVTGSNTKVMTRFEVHGDFDVQLKFDQLDFEGTSTTRALLSVGFSDDQKTQCRLYRCKDHRQKQVLTASIFREALSSTSNKSSANTKNEGTLRISRIGDTVIWLFAGKNANTFEVLRTESVSDSPVTVDRLRFGTFATGGSKAAVRWRHFTLRAERILHHTGSTTPVLFVISSDGSQRRQLLTVPEDYTSLNAPDWSPDGSQLVFAASYGDDESSRLMVIDADGTRLQDHGPGSLPGFSPDGQQIVFSEKGEGVIVMRRDGTGRRRWSEQGWSGCWGRNSNELLWIERNRILRSSADSPEPELVLQASDLRDVRGLDPGISVSPDGQYLAMIHKSRTGGPVVSIRGLQTTDKVIPIYKGAVRSDVSWSPDSSSVLVTRTERECSQLIRIDLKDRYPVTPIGEFPPHWSLTAADWSPDGQSIAVIALVSTAPIEWHGR